MSTTVATHKSVITMHNSAYEAIITQRAKKMRPVKNINQLKNMFKLSYPGNEEDEARISLLETSYISPTDQITSLENLFKTSKRFQL